MSDATLRGESSPKFAGSRKNLVTQWSAFRYNRKPKNKWHLEPGFLDSCYVVAHILEAARRPHKDTHCQNGQRRSTLLGLAGSFLYPGTQTASLLCLRQPPWRKVSGDEMADTTGNHEYEPYGETPDVPVNCAAGDCIPTVALRLALLLLLGVVFLVGVSGNLMLACMTRFWPFWKRNLYMIWFYHLAVADLFFCLYLPALVVPIIWRDHCPYGVMGCRALPFVILLSMYAKVLLLTALSLDIFLLVLKPTWWTENRRQYWRTLVCLGAWTLALLLAGPLDIYHQVLLETYPSQFDCVLDYGSWTVAENTVTAIQFSFGFLGPLVVMAGCHGALRHREGRHRWPLSVAAAVCFLVCWAPYHVLGLVITMAGPSSTLWTWALRAEPFVVGLALAHSCLNPMLILYFGRARLSRSLPAACHWALKDGGSNNERVINRNSSSHQQVSETEVRLEGN